MIVLLNSLYKGGIGKTSNSVILTHILAEKGYKILFIDCDPQGNGTRFLTTKSTSDVEFQKKNIFEAVKHNNLKDNILRLKENIDYVPGNEYINIFERMMESKNIASDKRNIYFTLLLQTISQEEQYDFVILDISPTKSALNTSIMASVTYHIITSQSEVFSVEMIQNYLDDIKELQTIQQVPSKVLGISLGMKDRTKLSKQVLDLVLHHYGNLVFNTVTKRKSKISEYAATGFPTRNKRGLYNMKDSDALALHWQLADEILTRLNLPLSKRRKK